MYGICTRPAEGLLRTNPKPSKAVRLGWAMGGQRVATQSERQLDGRAGVKAGW